MSSFDEYAPHLGQIKQLNEPIEVKFTEWNTGGLLTRIEVGCLVSLFVRSFTCVSEFYHFQYLILQGLRAFLPKAELLSRVNNFTELKEKVS